MDAFEIIARHSLAKSDLNIPFLAAVSGHFVSVYKGYLGEQTDENYVTFIVGDTDPISDTLLDFGYSEAEAGVWAKPTQFGESPYAPFVQSISGWADEMEIQERFIQAMIDAEPDARRKRMLRGIGNGILEVIQNGPDAEYD